MSETSVDEIFSVGSLMLGLEDMLVQGGYQIAATFEDYGVIGFEMPSKLSHQPRPTVIDYIPDLGIITVSVQLVQLLIPLVMRTELLDLCNLIHDEIPGVTMYIGLDEEDQDELSMSMGYLPVPNASPETAIMQIVQYLEQAAELCMPLVWALLTQRLIYTIRTDNVVTHMRLTVTSEDCIDMLRIGKYGTA